MKILSWIVLLAVILLIVFAAANWTLLATPASLNLLAFSVDGPLGLILVATAFFFVALCLVYVLSVRTNAMLETSRHFKQLEAQRKLADDAEASRFMSLTAQIEQEFAKVRASIDASRAADAQHVQHLEQTFSGALNETGNAIAAHVGQIDDKLDRLVSGGDRIALRP